MIRSTDTDHADATFVGARTCPAGPARRLGSAASLGLALTLGLGLLGGSAQADDTAAAPAAPDSLSDYYHQAIAPALGQNEILDAIIGGTPSVDLRLGYEYSDFDDGAKEAASGLSLRSRFNYKSGTLYDSSFFVQLQNNWNLIEDFRYPGGGDSGHDIIADPDGTRIHQLYADLGFIPDLKLRVGLQEIVLDNARLIGNVGWRNNAQSFNGVAATYTGIEKTELYAAYLWDEYNIFLKNDDDLNSLILLRAQYKMCDEATASVFAYLTDYDTKAADSATYGARVWGGWNELVYDFTGAFQTDYEDGDNSGYYGAGFVGYNAFPIKFGVGAEYISGGGGEDNFDTLFGTAHAFNGFADQFLGTNGGGFSGGLQDYYAQASTTYQGFNFKVAYHYFHTTDALPNGFEGEYGQEVDVDVTKTITKHLKAQVRYANYFEGSNAATNPTTDEQVLWLRLMFSY